MNCDLIKLEEIESKKYDFIMDENGNPVLSMDNVYRTEAVFRLLNKSSKLKKAYERLEKDYSVDSIANICKIINSENSTHLQYKREAISQEIYNKCSSFADVLALSV